MRRHPICTTSSGSMTVNTQAIDVSYFGHILAHVGYPFDSLQPVPEPDPKLQSVQQVQAPSSQFGYNSRKARYIRNPISKDGQCTNLQASSNDGQQ
jgi:hypothetical protein